MSLVAPSSTTPLKSLHLYHVHGTRTWHLACARARAPDSILPVRPAETVQGAIAESKAAVEKDLAGIGLKLQALEQAVQGCREQVGAGHGLAASPPERLVPECRCLSAARWAVSACCSCLWATDC